MALTARDPADRVEQLIVLTERLTAMLEADAHAFETHAPHLASAQVAETAALANIYRHESARVRADASLIADAPAERRRRLLSATKLFETVLVRHGRALRAAKAVTEGLVQAIAEEVARQRSAVTGYGPLARSRAADGSAIALNRRA